MKQVNEVMVRALKETLQHWEGIHALSKNFAEREHLISNIRRLQELISIVEDSALALSKLEDK